VICNLQPKSGAVGAVLAVCLLSMLSECATLTDVGTAVGSLGPVARDGHARWVRKVRSLQ